MQQSPQPEIGADEAARWDAPRRRLPPWTARADVMIALGAVVGVLARYGIGEWSRHHLPGAYPTGTFAINLAGCFVIGIAQYLFGEAGKLGRSGHQVIVVGFCGGFTTFSTFSVETLRLIQQGHPMLALLYQTFSLAGGILAVLAGMSLTRRVVASRSERRA